MFEPLVLVQCEALGDALKYVQTDFGPWLHGKSVRVTILQARPQLFSEVKS